MAGIDKTYITHREYPLYRRFWIENYEKMIKELGKPIFLYSFEVYWKTEGTNITPSFLETNTKDIDCFNHVNEFPIWNTTEAQDKWLAKNCNIESYRERLIEQYPHNWKGFKGQTWLPKKRVKQKCKK